MRRRYLSRVKQYAWIVLLCMVLAVIIGFGAVKVQKPVYQASTTMYVPANGPANSFQPSLSTNDSIGLATEYASQILSSSVMQYIYQFDPKLKDRGYGVNDLLADITTTPSATSSTFQVIASASNQSDAALLANDVSNGFQTYIQAQAQQELNSQRTSLQNQLAAAEKQKSSIQASLLTVASNTDPHFTVYNSELTDTYHTIDTLQQQLVALPATAMSYLVVIQAATPQSAVPAIKTNLLVAITAGIGLLLGIFVMLLVIYLDNRLQGEEQIRELLEMAYLGGVAPNRTLHGNPIKLDDSAAQEIGDIGANLRLLDILPDRKQGSGAPVLLVTSAQSSEGKTTIATALASAIAAAGSTVLLIDANLQRPAAHLSYRVNNSNLGLSGLLKSTGNADDVVQRTGVPGVWLLTAGAPARAYGLLLEQRLPALLAHLRSKAVVVVVDGPAVLNGSEAGILASMADGVVLVIDSRYDRLPLLLRAREVLNSSTHAPIGVVMNHFRQRGRNRYYMAASSVRSKIGEAVATPIPISTGTAPDVAQEVGPGPSLVKNVSAQQSMPTLIRSLPVINSNGMMLPSSAFPRQHE